MRATVYVKIVWSLTSRNISMCTWPSSKLNWWVTKQFNYNRWWCINYLTTRWNWLLNNIWCSRCTFSPNKIWEVRGVAGLINKAVALNRVCRCSFRGEEVNNFPSGITFQYTIEKVYTNQSIQNWDWWLLLSYRATALAAPVSPLLRWWDK